MDRDRVFSLTDRCMNGQPASCTYACPFRLDLRSFMKKMARKRWDAAYQELCSAVLFPAVTSRLCPHPCQDHCQCETVLGGDPIAIRRLEQACLVFSKNKRPVSYPGEARAQRVAVVGAGPAGLGCALRLAQKQFSVAVFDRLPGWGGALRTHADFPAFDEEFSTQLSAADITFHFERDIAGLGALDGYGAVVLATGGGGQDFGMLGSWDPRLATTANPRVFLAGQLTGLALMEGMAQAGFATRSVESYLLSGSAGYAAEQWDTQNKTRYALHQELAASPHTFLPEGPPTEAAAQAEAARCMQCDCTACMDACELLVKYKKKPPRIASDVFQDGQAGRNSVSKAAISRQSWSCNLCGRCTAKCAQGADLEKLFCVSRASRIENGYYPPAYHDYWLREMAHAADEAACAAAPAGQTSCEYAFFPGCRLGQANPDYVLRPYALLKEKLDVGLMLNCCGIPAHWAGEEGKLAAHLAGLAETWGRMGRPRLIVACPSCAKALGMFLPQIPLISLYEVLGQLAFGGGGARFSRAAVFDPCAARGDENLKSAVRALAASAGAQVAPFDSDGRCCGFGGHMQLADPELYDAIRHNRADENELPYIVYCVNCHDMFTGVGKPCVHILDLVFGLDTAGVAPLHQKRINGLLLKKELLKTYWGVDFEVQEPDKSRPLIEYTPLAAEKMERQLISPEEVAAAVQRGEREQDGFVSPEGDCLSRYVGPAATCWVRYSVERAAGAPPKVVVRDVYSHRMRLREEA